MQYARRWLDDHPGVHFIEIPQDVSFERLVGFLNHALRPGGLMGETQSYLTPEDEDWVDFFKPVTK